MSDASTAAAPAAPRPRQRILTTARTLFYCEGIHATGVQRLADTPPPAGFCSGSTRRGCVLRRAPSAAGAPVATITGLLDIALAPDEAGGLRRAVGHILGELQAAAEPNVGEFRIMLCHSRCGRSPLWNSCE
jgi:hypothetical protein